MRSTQLHSNQESKIENCFITVCICPFYGVIISGSLECSALHGGAIAVSENAKLTVEKCLFSECVDTFPSTYGYGGAVFSNGSDCFIENSSFSKCTGTGSHPIGGAFTHITNRSSIIVGCSFENCSAAYGGSVAWYHGGSGSIYNSVFKCSRATLRYAGTVFLQHHKSDFVISNCHLYKGDAPLGSGGFDASDNINNKSLEIQFCLFENNTVQKLSHGADIFIGNGYSLDNNTVQILHCLSYSIATRKVVQCAKYALSCGDDDGVAYDSYLPSPQSEIHISNSGNDVNTCGGVGSECQTVEYGVTRWREQLNQNVYMGEEVFVEDIIEIDWRNIVLSGIENGKSTIKSLETSLTDHLISVGNGSLNAKRISFACVFNRSAITIGSSGSLQLELCSFTKSAQSNQPSIQPLINAENGYVTIESVNVTRYRMCTKWWMFECIMRCRVVADGNGGGALFLSLQNTCSATISSCSFEECEAPFGSHVGYGGGIFLDLGHSDASLTIETPSFSVEKPNKAKHGND
eukprot:MONOS_11491.1-p1 / transcript=MONOS_11491.1 / gene=MONOS_11491 / organism=Monocercomonoides_exilis_PA203 / gene_product=unspecified product / transcript_product=unspecified product / location=Mono_scaffold00580:29-1851(-) / protein_length=519 / sequence_SO=supercontig / SO=protein_coding / is_pseudo=false